MNAWELKKGLKGLIFLLIQTHPAGFRVLLGEHEPPTDEDIQAMVLTLYDPIDPEMRVDGGGSTANWAERFIERTCRFDEIIKAAGGWGLITSTCREWSEYYALTWRIVVDYFKYAYSGFSRIDESLIDKIATAHKVSSPTVFRRVEEFPGELARAILLQPESPVEKIA